MLFVQTGDLHLGAKFSKLGNRANKQRKRLLTTFSAIIELTIKQKADALLICGDLFDTCFPSQLTIDHVNSEFKQLKKENIPVFIIPGNHDCGDKNPYDISQFPSNVNVFIHPQIEVLNLGELSIYGCAFNYKNPNENPLKNFTVKNQQKINIALVHGSYTKFNWSEEDEKAYAPLDKKDIENTGLDYLALGHFHKASPLDTKIPAWYAGTPEPLSFSQPGDAYVLLVEIVKGKVNVQKKQINETVYETKELDITQNQDKIFELLKEKQNPNKIFRLIIKGTPSKALSHSRVMDKPVVFG